MADTTGIKTLEERLRDKAHVELKKELRGLFAAITKLPNVSQNAESSVKFAEPQKNLDVYPSGYRITNVAIGKLLEVAEKDLFERMKDQRGSQAIDIFLSQYESLQEQVNGLEDSVDRVRRQNS